MADWDVNYDNNPLGPKPRPPYGVFLGPLTHGHERDAGSLYAAKEPASRPDVFLPENDRQQGHREYLDTYANALGWAPNVTVPDKASSSRARPLNGDSPNAAAPRSGSPTFDPHSSAQDAATDLLNFGRSQSPAPGMSRVSESPHPDPRPPKRKATSRANMLARGGACDFCKKRKLKCSAGVPSCETCLRMDQECVYSQKQQRSRVRVLEEKVMQLEKRLGAEDETSEEPAVAIPLPDEEHMKATTAFTKDAGDSGSRHVAGASRAGQIDGPAYMSYEAYASVTSSSATPPVRGHMATHASESSGVWKRIHGLAAVGAEVGFRLPEIGSVNETWDDLNAEEVAHELLRACIGLLGVGGRIVNHLLTLRDAPEVLPLYRFLDSEDLDQRLRSNSDSPIHPALLLALCVTLLPLAGSVLRHMAGLIAKELLPAISAHASSALAASDPRLLDIVSAQSLSSLHHFSLGEYHLARQQSAGATSLAWACGLGKLGGIVERWVGTDSGRRDQWEHDLARERLRRIVQQKAVLLSPPVCLRELAWRVDLFWEVFLLDKASSLATGLPSTMMDDEITTPFPVEDRSNASDWRSAPTLQALRQDYGAPAHRDSLWTRIYKAVFLLHRAARAADLPYDGSSADAAASLKQLGRYYTASYDPETLLRNNAGTQSFRDAYNLCSIALYMGHGILAVDSSDGLDERALNEGINHLANVVDRLSGQQRKCGSGLEWLFCIVLAQAAACSVRCWRYLHSRPEHDRMQTSKRCLELGKALRSHLEGMETDLPAASKMIQMLDGLPNGGGLAPGLYIRPDNIQ